MRASTLTLGVAATLVAATATLATATAAVPPAATVAPPPAAAVEAPAAVVAPPQDSYIYQSDGRRDPFTPLTNAGIEVKATKRGEGAAAFTVDEISVRGVMQTRERLVAMVQGPDNKTYVVHPGDKFADGVIKTVTPQGLVVVQDITDPLSTQKQREVRKLLRSLEEAKE
jgi:Tfp pilus assembly protein PilP